MLCPSNETKSQIITLFHNSKLILEIKSPFPIKYQHNPPRIFSKYLYPGSISIVKMKTLPDRFPLKVIPWERSNLRKIFSNDKISTGYSDKMYSLYIIFGFNPKKSLLLSSKVKAVWIPIIYDEISTTDFMVEKFDSVVNGDVAAVKNPSSIVWVQCLSSLPHKLLVEWLFHWNHHQ